MSLFDKPKGELAVGVIGAGRVGGALARALGKAGHRVSGVARRRSGAGFASPESIVAAADIVFLAVPDGAIQEVADALPWRAGQAAVHLCGALHLDVLRCAAERGAHAGCLHPLQAFPAGDFVADRFAGITCGIEGTPALSARLDTLARDLGARVLRLDGANRALYHAAAVFASNYAIALLVAARRSWSLAGLPEAEAREALLPLMTGAIENARGLPLERALSGPVARGDSDTVSRHLAALGADADLAALYGALGTQLLELELGHGFELRARLRALLDPA
jgi:predicted short-subunit dehydrogenase-like oxidoreductase (DUF2520 family)